MMAVRIDLRSLKVLVVSADTFGLNVLRAALHLADIRDIVVVRDCDSAMRLLRTDDFSALFCDGEQPAVGRLPFAVAVRRAEGMRNPMLPVFLVSAVPGQRLVSRARDLGVNSVLARPISAAAIARKLSIAIHAPRPFIVTSEYFGPDRRVRDKRRADDRRKRQAKRVAIARQLLTPSPYPGGEG